MLPSFAMLLLPRRSRLLAFLILGAMIGSRLAFVSIPIKRLNLQQHRRHGTQTTETFDTSSDEWAELEKAAEANKEEFEVALKAKLNEWKEMKAAGILDKLNVEEPDEDIVQEMDEMSKRLIRRRRGLGKKVESSDNVGEMEGGGDEQDAKAYARSQMSEKLVLVGGKKGSSLGVQSLLNEIKDKDLLDGPLVEACLMALSRLDSAPMAVSAYKQYQKWIAEGKIAASSGSGESSFGVTFANSCFASELGEAGNAVQALLVGENLAKPVQFVPGLTCEAIYKHTPTSPQTLKSKANRMTIPPALSASLQVLYAALPELTASQVNIVIRALGKKRLVPQIFELLAAMRKTGPQPDDESLEFLANALVATVEEEAKTRAMKDLPASLASLPEVVFAGRSNVGKSSLVNFLLNRKALASTSATPGHTTQFHFFAVNQGRHDLPSFRIVDVPGLGYAEAAENTQDSWRSLLERYLTVRDSLGVVFHLIDSRHKITAVDEQLMEMAARAATMRHQEGKTPFRYAVILTKTDRASEKALRESIKDVEKGTASLAAALQGQAVPIISTSSVGRVGRDELWKLLQGWVTTF